MISKLNQPIMKSFTLLLCLSWCMIGFSQNVQIPDANFEKVLIDLNIDSDKTVNGQILKSDALLTTQLDVSNKKIKSLKGIEAFETLRFLNCEKNLLTNINLSQNIALTTVITDVNNVVSNDQNNHLFMWID